MTERARPAVAAGTFYPADAAVLASDVDRLITQAVLPLGVPDPVGLVVPHAGYAYSGPVAATAYALLAGSALLPIRVVLLGPSHFAWLRGPAVPDTDAWTTPLGTVRIDASLRDVACGCGAARDDGPHASDHALEVQLPFLQRVLGSTFSVLPVAVGESDPEEVAALVGALADAGGFVVVSTDLSHYHDHRTARAIDARTAQAVLARDAASIEPGAACGFHALRGLVAHVAVRRLAFVLLDLRTSGDVTGDRGRVVGYGAFAVIGGNASHPT